MSIPERCRTCGEFFFTWKQSCVCPHDLLPLWADPADYGMSGERLSGREPAADGGAVVADADRTISESGSVDILTQNAGCRPTDRAKDEQISGELVDEAVETEEIADLTAKARQALDEVFRLDRDGRSHHVSVKVAMNECIKAQAALSVALALAWHKARSCMERSSAPVSSPVLDAKDVQKVIAMVGSSHRLPYPDNCETIRAAHQWARGQPVSQQDLRHIGLGGDEAEGKGDGASV